MSKSNRKQQRPRHANDQGPAIKEIIHRTPLECPTGLTRAQIEHYESSLVGCILRQPTIADRLSITPSDFVTIAGDALESIQRQLSTIGNVDVVNVADDVLGSLDRLEAGSILAKWCADRDPDLWRFFEARLMNPGIQSHRLVMQKMGADHAA